MVITGYVTAPQSDYGRAVTSSLVDNFIDTNSVSADLLMLDQRYVRPFERQLRKQNVDVRCRLFRDLSLKTGAGAFHHDGNPDPWRRADQIDRLALARDIRAKRLEFE